jgi:hypothetical protein
MIREWVLGKLPRFPRRGEIEVPSRNYRLIHPPVT